MPEFVALSRVRGLDICLLAPDTVALDEYIHRTRGIYRIVILVAVDSFCAAALKRSRDSESRAIRAERDTVTFQRAAVAEVVAHFRIGSLDVGDLLQLRIRGLGKSRS